MQPLYFDLDHHLTEPPDFWNGRFSKKHEHLAPKFMHHPELGPGWSWDGGKTVRPMGVQSVAAEDPRKIGNFKSFEELDPGCYDPKKRIEVMDVDGAKACILFPSGVNFFHGRPDPDFYVECASVYNDAAMDWSRAADGKRVFPAAVIPMRDQESAEAELARTAKNGHITFMLSRWPSNEPIPTRSDDHWWQSVMDSGMTVSVHGFGAGRPRVAPSAPTAKAKGMAQVGTHQEMVAAGRGAGLSSTEPMAAFIFSGVMDRFPDLKLSLIETSIGWLPYFAEAMDAIYLKQRFAQGITLKRLPSEYVSDFYASFDREWLGLKYRSQVGGGVDKVTFATDYPHIGSFYPHTRFYLELLFQGMSEKDQEAILWSNAAKLYGVS